MDETAPPTDNTYTKPTYDGRQGFYEVIKKYLENIADKQAMGDHNGWYRLLRGYYSLIHSFISVSNRTLITDKLEEIGALLKMNSKYMDNNTQNTIDTMMYELSDLIFLSSKHLFVSFEDETDIDEQKLIDRLIGDL